MCGGREGSRGQYRSNRRGRALHRWLVASLSSPSSIIPLRSLVASHSFIPPAAAAASAVHELLTCIFVDLVVFRQQGAQLRDLSGLRPSRAGQSRGSGAAQGERRRQSAPSSCRLCPPFQPFVAACAPSSSDPLCLVVELLLHGRLDLHTHADRRASGGGGGSGRCGCCCAGCCCCTGVRHGWSGSAKGKGGWQRAPARGEYEGGVGQGSERQRQSGTLARSQCAAEITTLQQQEHIKATYLEETLSYTYALLR